MNFGQALEALESGKKVSRAGWNCSGMWLFFVPGSEFIVNLAPLLSVYIAGTKIVYQPHVDMKTAQGTIVPWMCSQSDMLAKDWGVVD